MLVTLNMVLTDLQIASVCDLAVRATGICHAWYAVLMSSCRLQQLHALNVPMLHVACPAQKKKLKFSGQSLRKSSTNAMLLACAVANANNGRWGMIVHARHCGFHRPAGLFC